MDRPSQLSRRSSRSRPTVGGSTRSAAVALWEPLCAAFSAGVASLHPRQLRAPFGPAFARIADGRG